MPGVESETEYWMLRFRQIHGFDVCEDTHACICIKYTHGDMYKKNLSDDRSRLQS